MQTWLTTSTPLADGIGRRRGKDRRVRPDQDVLAMGFGDDVGARACQEDQRKF